MKTVLLTLTYLVGLGELALAVFFWVTNSKSEIRKVMALLAFSTGMWAISNALSSYTNPSEFVTLVLGIDHALGAIIVTTLLYMAIIFPYKIWTFDKLHSILLYLPAFLFSILSLSTKTIAKDYIVSQEIPGTIIPGPLFIIYSVFISISFLASLSVLYIKIRKLEGMNKRNSIIVFWSILIGGLPGVVISAFQLEYYLFANIFTFFWLAGTTLIILRK